MICRRAAEIQSRVEAIPKATRRQTITIVRGSVVELWVVPKPD
jgi:hypothetical protein